EPFLFNHFPALRATVGAPLYPNCPRSLLGPSFAGIATTLSLTVFTYLWVRSSADCKATSSPIAYQPEHAVGFVPGDFHRDALGYAGVDHVATGGAAKIVKQAPDASFLAGSGPGFPEISRGRGGR